MSLAEHVKEHIELGLDVRFPADGKSYFKFSKTKVELFVNGAKVQEW